MAIWKRDYLWVVLIFVTFSLVIIAVQSRTILQGFVDLEKQYGEQYARRSLQAVEQEIRRLDTLAQDWALWDDTYQFAVDRNQRFLDTNATEQTMRGGGLSFLLIAGSQGQMVFALGFDQESDQAAILPDFPPQSQMPDRLQADQTDDATGVSGVVQLPSGLALFASHPIRTSEGLGPSRGSLVMGRFVDSVLLNELSETAHLPVQVDPWASVPPEQRSGALAALAQGQVIISEAVGEDVLHGHALLRDPGGTAVALLSVKVPREIYRRGLASSRFMTSALSIANLAFLVAVFYYHRQAGALDAHRQAAERRLRHSEERYRRLAENAQDLIFRFRLEPLRTFEYVSPAATAVTGYIPKICP